MQALGLRQSNNPLRSSIMHVLALLTTLAFITSTQTFAQGPYPITKTVEAGTELHGVTVGDPYRWLETTSNPEVANWIAEQEVMTASFLGGVDPKIRESLNRMAFSPSYALPHIRQSRSFWLENQAGKEQATLRTKTRDGQAYTLVDPNDAAPDGSESIASFKPSPDGNMVAYTVRKKGMQQFGLIVRSIDGLQPLSKITDQSASAGTQNIIWSNDSAGIYYTRTSRISDTSTNPYITFDSIYYHKVGQSVEKDIRIIGDAENKTLRYSPAFASESLFVCIVWEKSSQSTRLVAFKILNGVVDINNPIQIGNDLGARNSFLGVSDGKIFIRTTLNADKSRIVAVDPAKPESRNWTTIVPEGDYVIADAIMMAKHLVLTRLVDVTSKVSVYDLNGNFLKNIQLPSLGVITNTIADHAGYRYLFAFEGINRPRTIYSMNLETFDLTIEVPSQIRFNSDDYVVEQHFVTGRQGTRIPIFISHKKGIRFDGSNALQLTGYGGFNYSPLPRFSVMDAAWLEMGGVYVVANVRGGGEYGQAWHADGMLLKKKNVFFDLIDVATWLINKGYTSPKHLAISGGSNGGLLVTASANFRPDLFGAVINMAGLTDLIRNETTQSIFDWTAEYGSTKNEAHFRNILSYSPIHNIKARVNYPAVMSLGADSDDRVPPWHQFKYIATLQASETGPNPKLLYMSHGTGHGAGKPLSITLREYEAMLTFMAKTVGPTARPH